MDWKNLVADVTRILPCHYTHGRSGSVQGVTVHHMAGDLSVDDCYGVWTSREASAHYAVQSDGTIGQLVNDWDTAWACGHDWANANTISIEHANDGADPWTVHPEALDAGAHLTAAICAHYGLGEPEWLANVFPHRHWQATACPGELDGSQNAEYMAKAKKYYAELTGAAPSVRAVSVQLHPLNGTDAQRFALEWQVGGTYFALRNVACGLYLDVRDGLAESGAPVRVHTGNGSDAQLWRFAKDFDSAGYDPVENAPVAIAPKIADGLRLDVVGGSNESGAGIQVFEANGTAAQMWYVLDNGDATIELLNNCAGQKLALDVVNGGN